ncbi:unnamed protein product [Rotaria magnacalcarata]|uniref:Copper type II ascorbate-dependent monooxygenase C-terminal domain-containing protein n=1 Tax=Rotaria magnacalcarata TaxID=392030 RepID=A0A816MN18_9BILA|nr:unnamed protein product [Rotaria magnacalcarata]CAF4137166.1 unnamed protein product [Rotaria magnacalcarata]
MIKIRYDNPRLTSNLRDSSGIRFYLGNELRQYDLSYLVFGTLSSPESLAIPPNAEQFIVDSYCPPEATRNLPASGINIVSALPHTHLQGISVWTKLIRNNTAVQYLFNAEAFDFNHQFANRLPTPIKIYPGDAFATRCIYSTKNKNNITLGGKRTIDEMCSHTFSYYPIAESLTACLTAIDQTAWQTIMKTSLPIDNVKLEQWLHNLTWTSNSVAQWQEFYNEAQRFIMYDRGSYMEFNVLPTIPKYEDLQIEPCNRKEIQHKTLQMSIRNDTAPLPTTSRKIQWDPLLDSKRHQFRVQTTPPLSLRQFIRSAITVIPDGKQWKPAGVCHVPVVHEDPPPKAPDFLPDISEKSHKKPGPPWRPPGIIRFKRPESPNDKKKEKKSGDSTDDPQSKATSIVRLKHTRKIENPWRPSGHRSHNPVPYFDAPSLRWSIEEIKKSMSESGPTTKNPPTNQK